LPLGEFSANGDKFKFEGKFIKFGNKTINMMYIVYVFEPRNISQLGRLNRTNMDNPEFEYGFGIGTTLGELWQTWATIEEAERVYSDIMKAIFLEPLMK
jgi:hypothetical protein